MSALPSLASKLPLIVRRALFFCVLLAGITQSFATTYYVNAVSGNDSSNGTSTSSPWKTLTKVSVFTFRPGDQILLSRGQTWRETLVVSSSGTSAARITYGAYGSGAAPVLDQQHSRSSAVIIWSKHYVTVTGLTLLNSVSNMVSINNSTSAAIKSCALKNAGVHGIYVNGVSPAFLADHNTYTMDTTFKQAGTFIDVLSSVDSATISNNIATFSGTGHNPGIIVLDVNNVKIFGNIIYRSIEGIGVKGYTRSVTGAQVYDNSIYDTRDSLDGDAEAIEFTGNAKVPYYASGAIFRNYVQGGSTSINGIALVYANNSQVYDNIVVGPARTAGIHLSSHCPGALVYHNTIYNAPVGIAVYTGSTATIKNNIIVRTTNGINASPKTAATEDYNLFYNAGVISIAARGSHSVTGDPKFAVAIPSLPGDFKLKTGSPAIKTGVVLSSPFQMGLDPSGAAMPYASSDRTVVGWTRGAFVFSSSSSPAPAPSGASVPTADSVSPASGSGLAQTFSARYSDADGYTNLRALNLLFRNSTPSLRACWVRYDAQNRVFYLQDDAGKALIGPMAMGSKGTLQNSQCVLNGSGSSITASGNSLILNASITFKSTFAGSKDIRMYAQDVTTLNSPWIDRGNWTVP